MRFTKLIRLIFIVELLGILPGLLSAQNEEQYYTLFPSGKVKNAKVFYNDGQKKVGVIYDFKENHILISPPFNNPIDPFLSDCDECKSVPLDSIRKISFPKLSNAGKVFNIIGGISAIGFIGGLIAVNNSDCYFCAYYLVLPLGLTAITSIPASTAALINTGPRTLTNKEIKTKSFGRLYKFTLKDICQNTHAKRVSYISQIQKDIEKKPHLDLFHYRFYFENSPRLEEYITMVRAKTVYLTKEYEDVVDLRIGKTPTDISFNIDLVKWIEREEL